MKRSIANMYYKWKISITKTEISRQDKFLIFLKQIMSSFFVGLNMKILYITNKKRK